MKQSAKRLLSMILCLSMLLSLLPVTAMAAGGTGSEGSSSTPSVADAFGFKTDPPAGFDAGDGVHPFSQSGTNDTINMVPVKEVGLLTTNLSYFTFNSSINVYNFSIKEDEAGNEVSDLANFSGDTKLFDTNSSSYTPSTQNASADLFRVASGVAYDPTGSGRDNHVFYYGVDASLNNNYTHTGEGNWNYLPMKDFSYEGGKEGTVASGRLAPNEENSQTTKAYDWATHEDVVDEAPDKYLSVVAGNFNGNGKETVVLYDPQFGSFTLQECTVDGENIGTSLVYDLGTEIKVKNDAGDFKFYTLNEMVAALRNDYAYRYFPKFMPLVHLAAGDLDGDEKDELVVTVTPIGVDYAGYYFDCTSQVLIFNKENDGAGNAVWRLKTHETLKANGYNAVEGAAAVIGDFDSNNKNELVFVGKNHIMMMEYSSGQLTQRYSCGISDVAPTDNNVYPVYSIPSVGAVRLDGTGTTPYLFASGKFFQYKNGTFQKAYEVTSYMTFYDYDDPIRSQPIIGNFDGNTAGREQLFVAVRGTKLNGNITYGIDCLSVEDGDLSFKYTESDADALGRMVLTAPDADTDDGMVMRYTGKEYVFSNPEVMAVLQASPYFEDLLDDYENVGVTGFGTSSGTGSSFSNTVTNEVGAYVSFSQDFSVFGVKVASVEFQAAYSYEWSKTNETSHTYTTSISYEAGSGSNQVVMISTPVTLYHYDVLDASGSPIATSDVSVPDAPCYSVIAVEDYNASAELLGNPVIDSSCVVDVVPGQPQTYPSSKWQIDSYGGVTVPFDTPVLAVQGNAVVSQEVSWEDSQSLTKSYSHNIDVSGGGGAGGFVIGASYGHSEERSSTEIVTSSVSRSGSVANIPAGNPDYSFKWQFATWDILVGGYKVPVMGYIVSSVNQPPSVPQNLTATPGTDRVTLEWEPGYNSAVKFDIFRYYPDAEENYQYDLIGTVDGTETSFVCEGLNPSTRYYFSIRAVGDQGLRSKYAEPVAVTTISPGQALPQIQYQPGNRTVNVSSTRQTTFSTLASPASGGTVTYAWEAREDSSSAWETITAGTNVAGYSTRVLTLYNITESMDGTQYRCRISERSGAPYPAVVYTRAATLTVGRAPTTTGLISPANPSYGTLNQEVELKASVVANNDQTCGGNVSFQITDTATGEVKTLMAATVDGNATATWTPYNAGVYTIRAAYAGDETTEGSASEAVTYYVPENDDTPCYEITLDGKLVYGETIAPSLQSVSNGQSTAVSGATFKLYQHNGTEFEVYNSGWNYLVPGEYRVDAVLTDEVVAQKVFTVSKRPITITAPTISSIEEGDTLNLSSYVDEIEYSYNNLEEEYKHLFALSGVTAEKPLSGKYDISVVYADPDAPELIRFLQTYQPTFEKSVFTVIPSAVAANMCEVAFSAGVNGSLKAYVSTTSTQEITSSPATVSKGSTVFFSPEAAEGFSVSKWTINGTEVTEEAISEGKFNNCGSVRLSGNGLIVEGLQSNINVVVEFTNLSYTVQFSGTGGGSVTAIQGSTELSSPVKVCGGSSITFTAVPDEGKVVNSWQIIHPNDNGNTETKLNSDGTVYTGTTLTLENINEDLEVNVTYEDAGTQFAVTYVVVDTSGQSTDGGLVTFTTEGLDENGKALKGATVKLTASPKPGTAILRWEIYDGNDWVTKAGSTKEYTISNLQADTSIRVVIQPNSTKYTVDYSIDGMKNEDTFAGTLTAKTGETSVSSGSSRIAYSSLVFTYEESEDYEFVGWEVTGTKGTEASDGTTHTYTISSLNADTIVMAEVQKKPKVTVDSSIENGSVSVTYQWNGETVTPTANGYVYTGTMATVTATPADGYVVDTIKANGTTILTGDKTVGVKTADAYSINANTTLTATFAAIPTYTITFNTDGGSKVDPIIGASGMAVTAPEAPTKTGYTFDGWDKEIPDTMPAENMTIKAKWKINQYTITFDTDGGTEIASITQAYGTEVTAPEAPTRTGYTFDGWDKEIPKTMPAEDVTITAQWTPQDGIKYTVKHYYEKLNGDYEVGLEFMYGVTDTDTAAQAKNVDGFTAGSVTQQKIKSDGSTVIEILYTRNDYTLTIKPENGSGDIVTTVRYGAAVAAPADPTKTGYTFDGWDTEIPETMPAEDVTITAKWTVNQYTITFESNGGSEISPITQDYGTTVTAPEKPAKAGYGFGGWYEDETLSSTPFVFTEDTTITDRNITLYAKWNPLDGTKYTVKHNFENLDGSTYTTETEEMSGTTDTDTAAQAKTVTGFTAGSVTQQKIKGDESTVIEITYTRNTYTLTFKPENGEDDIVTTVKYGAAITAPADLEKTGYTFAGWDQEIPATMPAEDVTIKAAWTANQYTNTVENAKNGSVTADCNDAAMGDTVTLTVVPEKGYTLETLTVTDGNGDDISVTNLGDGKYSFTMPASKVTVKATFMEDNSMLNFFVDVPVDTFYYDAVLWAAKEGITNGTSDTTFSPNAFCNRAQVVTFLWRAAGCPAPKSSEMPFKDVVKGSYYYDAVLWAVENGITNGTGDGTFSPDDVCSRAQIVTFLWRAQGTPVAGTSNPFKDVEVGAYYTDAVLWAVENGITQGTSATTFSPNLPCNRAQAVTFLYRCLGK